MADAKLQVVMGLRDEISEKLSGIGGKIEGMSGQLKKAGMITTGAGAAITAGLGLATKAALDEEINIAHLVQTLKNVGTEYDDVKDNLESVISVTQRKTGTADDEQRDILSRLLLVTNDYDKALELLPTVLDLAAAGQMDATTAATYLGKAFLELEEGADEVTVRFGQASLQFKNMEEIQGRVSGSAEAMANPLTIAKASMGDLAESIGKNLLPMLSKVVDSVVPVIEKIMDWMEANPELSRTLVIVAAAIGGIMTVVGPLLIALPFLVAGIGTVSAAFAVLSASGGPIFLVVAAIAALIAIGVLVYKNWDTISAKAKEIWGAIVGFFKSTWETLTGIFMEHWDKILAILFPAIGLPILIARNWETITEKVREIFEAVKEKVKAAFEAIVGFVKEHWDKILAIIFPAVGIPVLVARNWGGIVDIFKGIWDQVNAVVSGIVSNIWEKIKSVFKAGINFLIGLAESWANMYVKAVNTIIGALNKIQVNIPDWVPVIGGKGWGIDLPMAPEVTLPRLAEGGIITKPTLALLGERGPEAVVPLGKGVININFNAPVYGFDDFKRRVAQAVRDTRLAGGLSEI